MRENILEFVKREIIGPDPVEAYVQDNGEEILINEPPRLRYGAGILFPQSSLIASTDTTSADEESVLKNNLQGTEIDNDDPVKLKENDTPSDVSEDFEEEIGLANNYLPSALGFSCFTKIPNKGYLVKIKAAIYEMPDYEI